VAEATVIADAFCHSMVRALVGALLKVGEGARPPSWPAQVLTARVRDSAVPVVPPHGLCLEEVCYPAPGQLAERALTKDAIAGRIRRLLALADRRAVELGVPNTEATLTPDLLVP